MNKTKLVISIIAIAFASIAMLSATNAFAFGVPDTGAGDSGGDCCSTGGTTTNVTTTTSTPQPAVCNYLKANGKTGTVSVPYGTTKVSLTWSTSLASSVTLNGTSVNKNNSTGRVESISGDTTFKIIAQNSDGKDSCIVKVDVAAQTLPSCTISANPSSITKGGNSTLTWTTTNAASASINGSSVAVGTNKTWSVSPSVTTTYTMTVTDSSGNTATCADTVTVTSVPVPNAPTCTLIVNDSSVNAGDTVTLTWTTTNASTATIDNGIGSVSLSGNTNVVINGDTSYTLTATNSTGQSVTCRQAIGISGGGGGGGTVLPRCDLSATRTYVDGVAVVTLDWNTDYADEITLYEGYKSSTHSATKVYHTTDEDRVDNGTYKIVDSSEDRYTLLAERNGHSRYCVADVEEDSDTVVVTTYRDQQPVLGIALTQVPYTGFEAGPVLTFFFYALLALWGLFIAYHFVVKKDTILGFSTKGAFPWRSNH